MKTALAIILCGSLSLSALAQLTSDQLKDYVRSTWQMTDLTDSAIADTLDASYSGIPFKDWINGLDTAAQVNEQLRKQNYGAAAKVAAEFGTELGFNRLLAAVGLDGVSSVASLAVWPIDHALNAFVDTVKQKTFRDQCARYFAARTHNTAEEIRDAAPFDPLDADVNGGTLYKDQHGWLVRVTSDTTTASVLGFDSAAQFYELAEKLWQAREQTQNLADDSREVASAFRQAATPSAPVITISPTAQTITEGETATFSVVATGSGTLTYRWRRDGEVVDGATDSGFTTGVAGCYQAEVVNAVGSAFSHTACLTVQPVQPVSLTAPSAGATLAGSVSVRASANGATKVEFWLDGVRKSTDNTSPYTWSWDTTSSADGAHELVAKAFSGTTLLDSTPARTVTVDNTSAGDCSDATEPNNSSTTGTWLPVGASTNASICTASDVDWFRIPVTAPGQINITVNVPAGLDYELELYGPDGAWQAGSYRAAGESESVTFAAATPGTYLARVYGYPTGNGSHSSTSTYTIAASRMDGSASGLVAYYPFNGNANDASGNGNNGTSFGAVLTTNRFGAANSAYDFNGNGNYIGIPQSSTLNGLATDLTLSAWIYQRGINPGHGYRILDKCPAGVPGGWTFDTWDGSSYRRLRLQAAGSLNPNVIGATVYPLMQWHHVVATVSGTTGKVYLDGSLDGTGDVGSIPQNALDIFIGRSHPYGADAGENQYFHGLIDDVRIYNRALSASEVQDLYNSTDGQQISGTIMLNVQPASHRASLGDSTVFSVSASGSGVLGYQWQRNGQDIPGATNSAYTTPPLSLADSGAIFLARVANAFDSIFSAPAVLTVTVPRISNARLSSGGAIQFDVNSDDTRPHVIEGTTDLLHWSPVVTNTPVNGFFGFSEEIASGSGQRFYRLLVGY